MSESDEEIERFIVQARWIIEYHQKRSESFWTRAIALLGFVGVILALILKSGLSAAPDFHCLEDLAIYVVDPSIGSAWSVALSCASPIAFCITVGSLAVSGIFCLLTLRGQQTKAPGIAQLRQIWDEWNAGKTGNVAKDIAETFLVAKHLERDSVLDVAAKTANRRATLFGRAVNAMAMSLVSLTVLLIIAVSTHVTT